MCFNNIGLAIKFVRFMGNPNEHFGESNINQNYELIGINILRGDTTFEIKILLFKIFVCYKFCCI